MHIWEVQEEKQIVDQIPCKSFAVRAFVCLLSVSHLVRRLTIDIDVKLALTLNLRPIYAQATNCFLTI